MDDNQVLRTHIILALACFAAHYFFPSVYWLFGAASLLLLTVVAFPVARLIARGWMGFAERIGAFNAKIILFLLFYFVVTPWAFFVRLIREDPLQLTEPESDTTFRDRQKTFEKADFERIS